MSEVDDLLARLDASDPASWIERVPAGVLRERYADLDRVPEHARGPLHGVPFAVKDNIDVAGMATTAALPSASRVAARDATVVARLVGAGAVVVGKTNLDQLATGLVGTRSPYGTPVNPLDPERIPGGSSSGSATVVATGVVPFSLGTDTAGSGRVPAACTGIVGVKGAPGAVSTDGVVPASPSADCVNVFARDLDTAFLAHDVLAGRPWPEAAGPWRIAAGELQPLRGLVDAEVLPMFRDDVARVAAAGHTVDFVPLDDFLATGDLLYGGALLAERTAAIGHLVVDLDEGVDPTVREVLRRGFRWRGVDVHEALRVLQVLREAVEEVWRSFDALVVPTVPFVPTLAEVAADPIGVNERLGRFTTFANLLGLAAVTVPTAPRRDGLVGSSTVLGPPDRLAALRGVAAALVGQPVRTGGGGPGAGEVDLAVVGAHLRGQPLNRLLTERGGLLVEATTTAPAYRLHHLAGGPPERPGLERVVRGGRAIEVEVWRLPVEGFGAVVAEVPPPLGIGSLELASGAWVKGFVCEPIGLDGARDITEHGGWRAYLASLAT